MLTNKYLAKKCDDLYLKCFQNETFGEILSEIETKSVSDILNIQT
ncbi:MAG: hypothetical protein ACW96X_13605 [Promethearchaeota archaeon]|jgi:hypothetical protein